LIWSVKVQIGYIWSVRLKHGTFGQLG